MNHTDQPSLILCPECDQPYKKRPAKIDHIAHCHRCRAVLDHQRADGHHTLPLTITGIILFIIVNLNTFVSLNIAGLEENFRLIDGVYALFEAGMWDLAAVVFLTALFAPAFSLATLFYITLAMQWRKTPPAGRQLLRYLKMMSPWGMLEVFFLGFVAAAVKLADMATLTLDTGFYTFILLVITMSWTYTCFEWNHAWHIMAPLTNQNMTQSKNR
ncbi:paraquat-inducible protein A [Magnetococcales bacterium HHB-1]